MTSYLNRPQGRLAYDLTGDDGPLVVLSPGFGDLRSTYRGLATHLAAEGFRVVTADLRGHGDSTVGWDSYSVDAVAGDLLALLHEHGGRGVLVGNSYSGSAAVVAAARVPAAVAGLVLSGAFVRDAPARPSGAAWSGCSPGRSRAGCCGPRSPGRRSSGAGPRTSRPAGPSSPRT